jgi:predicted nucleic acid-binding protein
MLIIMDYDTLIPNAECLITFYNADNLSVLKKAYKNIIIAPEIKKQFEKKGRILPKWIKVEEPNNKEWVDRYKTLVGIRKAQSLVLAAYNDNSIIVFDDIRACEFADELGLHSTYTIGVINKAKYDGIITPKEADLIANCSPILAIQKRNQQKMKENSQYLTKTGVPKIIKWVDWETAYYNVDKGKYLDCIDKLRKVDVKKIEDCLYDYFLQNGDFLKKKKFNGYYHQNMPKGAPIFEYNGLIYAYIATMRRWGDLIARVMAKLDGKEYQSKDQFWKEVEKEKKGGKPKKRDENSYYNYLDFSWSWDAPENKTATTIKEEKEQRIINPCI